MRASAVVICLEARADTIIARLAVHEREVRPLLAGADPAARIRSLKEQRASAYADADWIVQTDQLSPELVASEVVRAYRMLAPRIATTAHDPAPAAFVRTGATSYPIFVGAGVLDRLGELTAGPTGGNCWVFADERVAEVHGERAVQSIRRAGLSAEIRTIPSGERSKDFAVASELFRWLAQHRAERRDTIVAVGGGVTGDLAGFVAASYLRGIGLVHVPTTLLAMTDSSIGGKTGVNLPEGKNLVGAFHQPAFVLADVDTLRTLPERELRAGWAETIKHGLIRDPSLVETLETATDDLLRLETATLVNVIGRSVAVKAEVVSIDEREDGLRMILNYGHTAGHALEAAGDYQRLLHGEAVSIGMGIAARIGEEVGITPPTLRRRQDDLIRRFGLPLETADVPVGKALAALALDKKVRAKRNRWILLEGAGRTVVRDDVPADLVETAIREAVR
jgi:3-dehydroquinate synthase